MTGRHIIMISDTLTYPKSWVNAKVTAYPIEADFFGRINPSFFLTNKVHVKMGRARGFGR